MRKATIHSPRGSRPHFRRDPVAISSRRDAEVGCIVGLRPQRFNIGSRPLKMVIGAMGIRRPKTIVLAVRGTVAVATCLLLANCASSDKFASRVDPKYGVSSSPRVVAFGEAVPKGGGTYRIGKP